MAGEVVPDDVVVQVLCGHAAEAVLHHGLEVRMIGADALDARSAPHVPPRLHGDVPDLQHGGKASVCPVAVRAEGRPLSDVPLEDTPHGLVARRPEAADPADGQPLPGDGGRDAHLLLAQATRVHVAAPPVRRARHGEPAPAVVSLVGEAEEGLVGLDDAVHPHGIHHGLQ